MKTTAIVALAAATGAVAQIGGLPPVITNFIGNLSSSCQQTVLSLAISSDLSNCLHVQQVIPVLTSAFSNVSIPSASNSSAVNATSSSNSSSMITTGPSVIPLVDQLLQIECAQAGCSNATLTSAYNDISVSCASDLSRYNVSNSTLRTIFQQYPLAREVVCLQTIRPILANYSSSTNTSAVATNATSMSNSTSSTNSTGNGTYCATSLLNLVQNKVGQNLSVNLFANVATSYINGRVNVSRYVSRFNQTDLCNDCIYAAADVIGVAYPGIANLTLSSIGLGPRSNSSVNGTASTGNATVPTPSNSTMSMNGSSAANTTLSQFLNNSCVAYNLSYSTVGVLPPTIRLGAVNSTFGYNLTVANGTRAAPAQTTPIKRNVANIKARWIGERF